METVLRAFLKTKNGNLFYTHIGDSTISDECTIYFSPLFEERMWTQRISFNFANELWNNINQPVCLFDYPGYGESFGDTEDFTFDKCRQSITDLVNMLKKDFGYKRFNLWGVRTGCVLLLDNMYFDEILSVVLWAPVFELKKYMYTELRANVASQSSLFGKNLATRDNIIGEVLQDDKCIRDGYYLNQIEGYRFGNKLYNEILELNIESQLEKIKYPTFIIETSIRKIPTDKKGPGGIQKYIEHEN